MPVIGHLHSLIPRVNAVLTHWLSLLGIFDVPSNDNPARQELSVERLRFLARLFTVYFAIILLRLLELQTTGVRKYLMTQAQIFSIQLLSFVFACSLILAGSLFSVWRRKDLVSYAITEIAVGFLIANHVGYRLFGGPSLTEFLGSASALYVIARGFNNLHDARKSPKKILQPQTMDDNVLNAELDFSEQAVN